MSDEKIDPPSIRRYVLFAAFAAVSIALTSFATPLKYDTPRPARAGKTSAGFLPELGNARNDEEHTPHPSLPPLPDLSAESFLIQFIGESEPIAKSREWKQMRPASITKLLTAAIAREELLPQSVVPLSASARNVEEKISRVSSGEEFVRDDMIRLALVSSANDAAIALAEQVGRIYGAFLFDDAIAIFQTRAEKKIRELGMKETVFKNPTGLDDVYHVTSARDLFTLVDYLWRTHPELWRITRERASTIQSLAGREYVIFNTNLLLNEFPTLLGGKTGLTDGAKGTLVLLYPVAGVGQGSVSEHIAVIIILGSEDRFEDGRKLLRWVEEAF